MMAEVFIISFFISYLGSISPGVANVSVMQMAIMNHKRVAIFFSLAASLVEFCYAGLTVKFQVFLKQSTHIEYYFTWITAAMLILFGIVSLLKKSSTNNVNTTNVASEWTGFTKGIALGILNPMTIPFWLIVTAYIQNQNIFSLDGSSYWTYLLGISSGTFMLLMTVLWLGNKFTHISNNQLLTHKLPGFLLIGLGIYNIITWYL